MLLAVVLVVIIVAVAMLFAILSSFVPFSTQYWNIVQYSSAYYAAVSAIERWSLAVRKSGPGFDWESWWKYRSSENEWHYNTWNAGDAWLQYFVSYWDPWSTTLYWNVKSKTNSIPKQWEWNVDPAFIDRSINPKSYDYNALNYGDPILIPLWKVGVINPTGYYTEYWNYSVESNYEGIRWNFRINPYLFSKIMSSCKTASACAKLCTNSCPWSTDYSMDKWTPIVDWVIKWFYPDWEKKVEVSILPSEAVDVWSSYYVHVNRDSLIRKSHIWQNDKDAASTAAVSKRWYDVLFANHKHPLIPDVRTIDLNVLSNRSDVLKNLNNGNFVDIIKTLEDPYLSIELINYLWSAWSWSTSRSHHLYPFLEYRFTSEGGEFSDIYYTIKWEWRVWKYDVRLQVKKPTLKDSSLWNFTIIF